MIAVIFEVEPAKGEEKTYFDTAAHLRALLEKIEGFVSVERFQSLSDPGKFLSLSFFENEDAVMRWRNQADHRRAQATGRGGVFAGYRLRVAQVLRDYGLSEREEAPQDSKLRFEDVP
jgi:heme-degrading monooxygenase HmoA